MGLSFSGPFIRLTIHFIFISLVWVTPPLFGLSALPYSALVRVGRYSLILRLLPPVFPLVPALGPPLKLGATIGRGLSVVLSSKRP